MQNAKLKLCKATLVKELAKMNLVYSPAKHPQELKKLAEIWFNDLGWMDTELFKKAMARHLSTGEWFPSPAQIRGHYHAAKSESISNAQAALPMPEALTPAQVEANKKGIAGIRAALGGRLAMPTRGNHD